MAVSKPLLTQFGIDHRLESCEVECKFLLSPPALAVFLCILKHFWLLLYYSPNSFFAGLPTFREHKEQGRLLVFKVLLSTLEKVCIGKLCGTAVLLH